MRQSLSSGPSIVPAAANAFHIADPKVGPLLQLMILNVTLTHGLVGREGSEAAGAQ